MNVKSISMVLIFFSLFMTTPAFSQDLIVYPAKGQSQDQMERDKFECYTWAKGQTGFDPMAMPTATSPPLSQERRSVGGSTVAGGILGGAGGAVIGGIAGGSSGARKGAAIGGISGGVIGGTRSSRQNRQAEQQRRQWEQQQANQSMQQRNAYNRAHAVLVH